MTTNDNTATAAPTYTATVKPKGKGWFHTVRLDAEVVATRTTNGLTPYAFCYVMATTLNSQLAGCRADVTFCAKQYGSKHKHTTEERARFAMLEAQAALPGADCSKPLGPCFYEYARKLRGSTVTRYGEGIAVVPIAAE